MEEEKLMENVNKTTDIWEALEKLTYTVNLDRRAPRADRMYYQHLQEGIQNDDLDKIYEFIDAFERGRGPSSDERIRKLFQKAYNESPHRLCQVLAKRNSIIDYWLFLTTDCDTEMIQNFVRQEVPYPRFYFECARILLKQFQHGLKCEGDIVCAVIKIADSDLFLWKRWICRYERNMAWQTMIPHVLDHVKEEALITFAETINLDMSINRGELEVLTKAYQEIQNTYETNILKNISSIVWNRWCLLINGKKRDKEFQNKILITGYTNLILDAFQYTLNDKTEWKSNFLKYGEELNKDMYAWYKSCTNMMSIFFYDITQIYYTLFVGVRCQIIQVDEEINKCAQCVLNLIRKYEDFWDKDEERKVKLEKMLKSCN